MIENKIREENLASEDEGQVPLLCLVTLSGWIRDRLVPAQGDPESGAKLFVLGAFLCPRPEMLPYFSTIR